jgi:hypothetical protein
MDEHVVTDPDGAVTQQGQAYLALHAPGLASGKVALHADNRHRHSKTHDVYPVGQPG